MTGAVTLLPSSAALTWAGMSSGPSQVCRYGKVLRRERIEDALQVVRHVGIGVFVDRQRRRRVLDEDVQQADADRAQLRQRRADRIGDQMKPTPLRRQTECALEPRHLNETHYFHDWEPIRLR